MNFVTGLDTRLLRLSPDDYFTLGDATRSVACFGATGSGKTSGSGKALASAYLRAGMGGLVLCAKPDEVELWQGYARANGRAGDIVLFGDGASHGFNFIDYEMQAQGVRGIGSVTECVMRILEAERVVMQSTGGGSDPFWERSPRQLMNNTLPYLHAAWGTIRMEDIYRFVTSCPTSVQDIESEKWQATSFMFSTWAKAADDPVHPLDDAEAAKMLQYWTREIAPLDAKTRGNVLINLTSAIDRFLRGRLQQHFCRDTTIRPEDTFRDGAIIIMAMPSLSWNEDGIIGQHVFKHMWQRAVLRRATMSPEHRTRPVFLWADEAQYFVSVKDAEYQAACRSALGCTVYLSQSMPSYLASLGGASAKPLADQLLGNFATKIFHSNADPETNRWAAETIGRQLTIRSNYSSGRSTSRSKGINENSGESFGTTGSNVSSYGSGTTHTSNSGSNRNANLGRGRNVGSSDSESQSEGGSEVMDYAVEPRVFAQELRNGGRANGGKVDGILFQTGRKFTATEGNAFLPVTFRQ